jgi:DNA-directed RNA polymerase specialized sigma24 family protein
MKIYMGYGQAIEITDDWNEILLEADRAEKNNAKRETRRHCSLDAYNLDDGLLPSKVNIVGDCARRDEIARAVATLTMNNQSLVRWYFYDDLSVAEIAVRAGTKTPAVYRRLNRCIKNLKKYFYAV